MINGKSIGMALFGGGIVLLVVYGLYLGFSDLLDSLDVVAGFFTAMVLVGLVILVVSIIFEQRRDAKKMRESLREEDLKP
jgi:hypothetical protein